MALKTVDILTARWRRKTAGGKRPLEGYGVGGGSLVAAAPSEADVVLEPPSWYLTSGAAATAAEATNKSKLATRCVEMIGAVHSPFSLANESSVCLFVVC